MRSLFRSRGLIETATLIGPATLLARTLVGTSALLVAPFTARSFTIAAAVRRTITRTTSVATTSAAALCSGAFTALTAFAALASITILATAAVATIGAIPRRARIRVAALAGVVSATVTPSLSVIA
jgi:hypothetical protein